jgi:hypothetical protein
MPVRLCDHFVSLEDPRVECTKLHAHGQGDRQWWAVA